MDILVLLLALASCEYVSQSTRSRLVGGLHRAQTSNGIYGSLLESSLAVRSLQLLNEPTSSSDSICLEMSKSEAWSLDDVSGAMGLQSVLHCQAFNVKAATSKARENLASGEVSTVYLAATSLLQANDGGLTAGETSAIVAMLFDLLEDDGSFRNDEAAQYGSLESTGYALELLALLADSQSLSPQDLKSITAVFESIEALIATADGPLGEYLFFEDPSEPHASLSSTSRIVSSAIALANSLNKDCPISQDQMQLFTAYFLMRVTTGSCSGMFHALHALHSIATASPTLVLTVETEELEYASMSMLQVTVSDVLGGKVDAFDVTIAMPSLEVTDTMALVEGSEITHEVDVLQHKPALGFHEVVVKATPVNGGKTVEETFEIKVMGEIGVDKGVVKVVGSSDQYSAKFPRSIPNVIHVTETSHLEVTFTVRDSATGSILHPHQAFLRVSSEAHAASFVSAAVEDGERILVELSQMGPLVDHQSGSYMVEVVIGDACSTNGIIWNLGHIEITFARQKEARTLPSAQGRAPPPATNHESSTLSSTFAALAVAPLPVFVVLALRSHSGLTAPTSLLWNGLFVLSIGAAVSTIVMHWIHQSLCDTLKCAGLSITGLFLFGSRALSATSAARRNQSKNN